MNRRLLPLACAALLAAAAACSGPDETLATESPAPMPGAATPAPSAATTPAPAEPVDPVELEVSVVAEDLDAPWGLAFLPDGTALVTERDTGRLLRLPGPGGGDGEPTEVQELPGEGEGEGGLLGLAVSPAYAEDGLLYAYYSTAEDNRVVRFRLGEQPEPVLTGIPVASIHNGGRLAFGPDGMLYVTTGEAGQRELAQDVESLGGKILRIAPDGSIPAGNPFGDSPVWSLGHRNVQGLAWDDEGRLYATEFGERHFDEVNLIEPGGNYGWPEVEGAGVTERFVEPLATFRVKQASPSGATILRDGAIPQWEGNLLFAGLQAQALWRLTLGPDGAVIGEEVLDHVDAGRLRHVAQAPDGSLWVLTSNRDGRGDPAPEDDRILRLGPPPA